jgi:tetratricopeptide (TPR) repeat protein
MADLDKAVELSPDFVAARFNRGSMHFSAGRYKEALVDFERCAAVDPHAPPPWFNLAMTREQLGDKEGAVSDLKRFLELTQTKEWREVAEKKLQDLAAKPKE